MRYQSRKFTCGPATVANVVTLLSHSITEDDACETSVDGTSERQIKAGLVKHGLKFEVHKGRDSLESIQWVDTSINLGSPTILCVDKWSHWVAVVGKLGGDYLVIDSADPDLLVKYTPAILKSLWNYKKRYYGIAVIKPVEVSETWLSQ